MPELIAAAGSPRLLPAIQALYEEAFPERERIPFGVLSDPGCFELLAITEKGVFLGFAACRRKASLSSLVYFAILPEKRSQGIGGAALERLLEHLAGTPVFIDIEDPETAGDGQALRGRRMRFYERHGFSDMGFTESWQGVRYRILSRGGRISAQDVQRFWGAIARPQVIFNSARTHRSRGANPRRALQGKATAGSQPSEARAFWLE